MKTLPLPLHSCSSKGVCFPRYRDGRKGILTNEFFTFQTNKTISIVRQMHQHGAIKQLIYITPSI